MGRTFLTVTSHLPYSYVALSLQLGRTFLTATSHLLQTSRTFLGIVPFLPITWSRLSHGLIVLSLWLGRSSSLLNIIISRDTVASSQMEDLAAS